MLGNTLQISQNSVNESFAPMIKLFGQFQEFTSEIIVQVTNYVTPFFENLIIKKRKFQVQAAPKLLNVSSMLVCPFSLAMEQAE